MSEPMYCANIDNACVLVQILPALLLIPYIDIFFIYINLKSRIFPYLR